MRHRSLVLRLKTDASAALIGTVRSSSQVSAETVTVCCPLLLAKQDPHDSAEVKAWDWPLC